MWAIMIISCRDYIYRRSKIKTVVLTAPLQARWRTSAALDKKHFILSCHFRAVCSDTDWRREENRAKKHTVGRGAESSVNIWGWGCWLSISTITNLKKSQHGTKIVSKKKDAWLPWSQRGQVERRPRVFKPSPQSPPLLLQLPHWSWSLHSGRGHRPSFP